MNSLRDSMRGYVEFDSLEWSILNSRLVQRTRFLRKLGWTYLVYPGAEHSRLTHSIGGMSLASKICDAIYERAGKTVNGLLVKRISRLFALLHSIGAMPFESHVDLRLSAQLLAGEMLTSVFTRYNEDVLQRKLVAALEGVSTDNDSHIARQVALSALMMDALLRDSRFAGVSYGIFDLDRLVDCLALTDTGRQSPPLSVDMQGLPALEGMALAAYSMLVQVYRHPRVAAAGAHFKEWVRHENLLNEVCRDERFCTCDDLEILTLLRRSHNSHAVAIRTRQFYPVIGEFREDPRREPVESSPIGDYLVFALPSLPQVSELFLVQDGNTLVKPESGSKFIRSIEEECQTQPLYLAFGTRSFMEEAEQRN